VCLSRIWIDYSYLKRKGAFAFSSPFLKLALTWCIDILQNLRNAGEQISHDLVRKLQQILKTSSPSEIKLSHFGYRQLQTGLNRLVLDRDSSTLSLTLSFYLSALKLPFFLFSFDPVSFVRAQHVLTIFINQATGIDFNTELYYSKNARHAGSKH